MHEVVSVPLDMFLDDGSSQHFSETGPGSCLDGMLRVVKMVFLENGTENSWF